MTKFFTEVEFNCVGACKLLVILQSPYGVEGLVKLMGLAGFEPTSF